MFQYRTTLSTRHLRIDYFDFLKPGDKVFLRIKHTDNVRVAMTQGFGTIGKVVEKTKTRLRVAFKYRDTPTVASFNRDLYSAATKEGDDCAAGWHRFWLCLPFSKTTPEFFKEVYRQQQIERDPEKRLQEERREAFRNADRATTVKTFAEYFGGDE